MSGGFSLGDYNTVSERIGNAKTLYPDGRFQSEVITLPPAFADKFIAVRATFYRTADDPTPAVGLAWEPVPGASNFTRQSELQNAETSAWGRALVAAFAADVQKGIASQDEIRNREPKRKGRASDLFEPTKPQNPTRATETPPEPQNGEPDLAAKQWSARLKLNLVEAYDGDKDEARTMWIGILKEHGYGADDYVKPEDRETIEQDVAIALLPVEQAPFL